MKKFLMALVFLCVCSPAFATNYYIDCAGNNSNSGLTTLLPWADFTPTETTNFLVPGDIVNVKTDCTFSGSAAASQVYIYSKGTAAHPITIQPYGGGADPIFDGSVDESIMAGWTGWTLFDAGTNTYISNVNAEWTVNGIIIDGVSTLRHMAANQCASHLPLHAGQCGGTIATPIYIRLLDGSDPATHTIRFTRYGNSDGDGHTRGLFGVHDSTEQYINIYHMQTIGSNSQCFSSGAPHVNFYNVTSFGCAREGMYVVENATQNANGASYNTVNNSTFSWSNSNFGQQVTIESNHTDMIDVISMFGWMAGIDWLGYPPSVGFKATDVYDDRCIRCIAHDNGQRSWDSDFNGFDPAGMYVDGGHNIQIIDSVVYAGTRPAEVLTASSIYGIAFQTEHPSTHPEYNIDLINTLIHSINFSPLLLGNSLNCSGNACKVNDNLRVVGCTLIPSNSHAFEWGGLSIAANHKGVFLFNNIMGLASANKTAFFKPDLSLYKFTMDYNVYTNNRSPNYMADDPNGTASVLLSDWQSYSGQDAHSIYANPLLVGSTSFVGSIKQDKHLSSLAAGDGADSPALGIAFPNYLGSQYTWSSIGTVRTDNVTDNPLAPAAGYHYLAQFQTSSFPSVQSGTDYY